MLHPYHLDVDIPDVAHELVSRTGHRALDAAIQSDVIGATATAQRYGPATRRAANIILLGSLAPTAKNGLADAEIVSGLISPANPDASIAMQSVQNIKDNALYIDDNPDAGVTRFSQQANVRREVEMRANAVSENDREGGIVECILESFSGRDGMGVKVFPTRVNNVPDDPDQVHIGVISPSYFTMQSSDLDAELGSLYRHSDGNGGSAPRNHRNNVLFLVASDGDLSEIKRQMARHKAANEILRDNGPLPEYQEEILTGISRNSRKAVYHGIQRNWVNLYYPEPAARSNRLQHARLQFPDQEGRGQLTIVEFLSGVAVGKMASPRNPALAPDAWSDAGLERAKEDGMSVGELHNRFTGTAGRCMFLKREHFDRSLDQANEAGHVVVRNPHGLTISSGSGVSYRDDMTVWLARHAPLPALPDVVAGGDNENGHGAPGAFRGDMSAVDATAVFGNAPAPAPAPVRRPSFFQSQAATGKVVLAELNSYLASEGLDWADISVATVYGDSIALLNDLAPRAQARGVAISVSYHFAENDFAVSVDGKSAEQWQQCSRACAQMQRVADVDPVSATIVIANADNADGAIRTMLHELDSNAHQAQLNVVFHQPAA